MNPKELHAACAMVLALSDRKKPKRRRRVCAKQWLQRRVDVSLTHLLDELQSEPEDYRNFLRMNETTFDELLNLVTPLIERKTTRMRTPVSAKDRLSLTLRYLTTGNLFEDLKFTARVSPQLMGDLIPETCAAIIHVLKDYMKVRKALSSLIEMTPKYILR
jgi:hypothetical protein